LLFVICMTVLLDASAFSSNQKLEIMLGAGVLFLALYLMGSFLTARAGDPLYSPAERALNRGANYGTELHPQPRRRALRAPAESPPIQGLLEGISKEVADPASEAPSNEGPGTAQ